MQGRRELEAASARSAALRRLEAAHYIYPLGGAGGVAGAVLNNHALRDVVCRNF